MTVTDRKLLLLLLCALMLTLEACGFRLRGSLGEFESIPPVYVQGGDPAAFELRQFLRTGGTEVVDDPARARVILTVAEVTRDRRVLSVGTRGRVQEYELIYRITYYAEDPEGRRVMDEQTLTQTRNFAFDEGDVIAKSNEEDFLFRDMQRNAVMQIMRRMQVVDFGAGADGPEVPGIPADGAGPDGDAGTDSGTDAGDAWRRPGTGGAADDGVAESNAVDIVDTAETGAGGSGSTPRRNGGGQAGDAPAVGAGP